jgi:hypothetical protein
MFWWPHRVSTARGGQTVKAPPASVRQGMESRISLPSPVSIPTRAYDGGFDREPRGRGLWKLQKLPLGLWKRVPRRLCLRIAVFWW